MSPQQFVSLLGEWYVRGRLSSEAENVSRRSRASRRTSRTAFPRLCVDMLLDLVDWWKVTGPVTYCCRPLTSTVKTAQSLVAHVSWPPSQPSFCRFTQTSVSPQISECDSSSDQPFRWVYVL